MTKIHILFIILISSIANANTKVNSYTAIKLKDLSERQFSMSKDFIIFEYENKDKRIFNSSINFFFNTGGKLTTKIYINIMHKYYMNFNFFNIIKNKYMIHWIK